MVCLLHRHEGGRGSSDEVTISSYFLLAFMSYSYSYSYIFVLYFWLFYVLFIRVFIHIRLIFLVHSRSKNSFSEAESFFEEVKEFSMIKMYTIAYNSDLVRSYQIVELLSIDTVSHN